MTATSPARMEAYFDGEATRYDEITRSWDREHRFYERAMAAVDAVADPVDVLDLGVGTGYELTSLFGRAPAARVTGIDVSGEMLEQLRRRHAARPDQLTLVQGSFVTWSWPVAAFDYVVAIATMHHFLKQERLDLYRRVRSSLRPGGRYIEGDRVVPLAREDERVLHYVEQRRLAQGPGPFHIDVPCSAATIQRLLGVAGFPEVELRVHDSEAGYAIVVATG